MLLGEKGRISRFALQNNCRGLYLQLVEILSNAAKRQMNRLRQPQTTDRLKRLSKRVSKNDAVVPQEI